MIIILEDNEDHRNELLRAFKKEGVTKDQLQYFSDYGEAEQFIQSRQAVEAELPVVIIADIGLPSRENGTNFIGDQFKYLRSKGSSVWTALISISESALRRDGLPAPLPHRKYAKGEGWAAHCAAEIAPLITAKKLPFDSTENDMAPLIEIKPADRIYIFSSGEAQCLHPNCEQTIANFFQFANFKNHYRRDPRPIVMYRGNYVVVNGNIQKNFVEYLLRYRTVANVLRQPFSIAHLQQYRKEADKLWVDETKGVAVRSIHNSMIDFKKRPLNKDLNAICSFLYDGQLINDQVPNFPDGDLPKRDEPISINHCCKLPAQLPEGIRDYGISDSFITRLQFILTRDEISDYKDWKANWEKFRQERVFLRF
jgi:hypothetical protein